MLNIIITASINQRVGYVTYPVCVLLDSIFYFSIAASLQYNSKGRCHDVRKVAILSCFAWTRSTADGWMKVILTFAEVTLYHKVKKKTTIAKPKAHGQHFCICKTLPVCTALRRRLVFQDLARSNLFHLNDFETQKIPLYSFIGKIAHKKYFFEVKARLLFV